MKHPTAATFGPPGFLKKCCERGNNLDKSVEQLARPLVFTNGVFDLLHAGHVRYLDQARQCGASLVVAVNGDASVKRLGKGADRPINSEVDRMQVLAALASVALVTVFDEDTPLNLILRIRPDVLVKGGDWPVERIVGATTVLARGGQVLSIPFEVKRSTTATLQRIRQAAQAG
ncbi:MAG: D-glycero-beta-D-manno-heptose 1-phosphate adenylyltransferase [Burkholderiaceae bacterium]